MVVSVPSPDTSIHLAVVVILYNNQHKFSYEHNHTKHDTNNGVFSAIIGAGLGKKVALITDGRFSGTNSQK